jgi:predicted permease
MRWLCRVRAVFAGLARRRALDDQLERDIAFHLDQEAAARRRGGLPEPEARRRARASFGSVDAVREEIRARRRFPIVEQLARDVRYGARGLRRNPGFATVAILSLALGIGANAAIFSLLNTVVLRAVAFAEPDRLFTAREMAPAFIPGTIPVNPVHAADWVRQSPSVESAALMRAQRMQLTGAGDPALLMGAFVSPDTLGVLGVSPILGRGFAAEEAEMGRDRVVILSESLWRSRFDADPNVVGRIVRLDGQPLAIVGVVPRSFRLPHAGGLDGVLPSAPFDCLRPLVLAPEERTNVMGNFNYAAVVRLRRDASLARALEEINAIEARYPKLPGIEDVFATLIPVRELFAGRARPVLLMLTAAAGVVLLIICVNLANLLLARMAARRREAAIRSALGASRARQMAQMFAESLLVAVIGGALGLVFAGGLLHVAGGLPLDIPRLDDVRLDDAVLAFTAILTAVTSVVFGAGPAWRYTAVDPQDALRASGRAISDSRGSLRLRSALIGLEVCLSTALLITAVLLSGSLMRVLHVDKGFDVERIVTADVGLAGSRYSDAASRERMFAALLARSNALPGVEASGVVTLLPAAGESWMDPIGLTGGPPHSVNNRWASPGYFSAMNIEVKKGRVFDDTDRATDVAMLSEKAAALVWPNNPNPVGLAFLGEDGKSKRLVGIVSDVRAVLEEAAPATTYYPYWQRVMPAMTLVVRTSEPSATIVPALRSLIRSADAQLPIPPIRTMTDVINEAVVGRRFQALLVGAFSASALVLSCLGIYGVVSYTVARRRNEIGIRMALGAPRTSVLGLVLAQGMAPIVVGLVSGIALALGVGQAIRGLLFEVRPAEPLVIAGVAAVLLAVGVLACLVPARRAAATNVVVALRIE